MKTAIRIAAFVLLIIAATTYHAWAAAQPAASIQPMPAKTTIGPGQSGEGGNTTLLTYNCTGGMQVMLPQEITQRAQTIVMVVYVGVEEHKAKCKLVGPETKEEPPGGIGIQETSEAGTKTGKPQEAQETTATSRASTLTTTEDSIQEATVDAYTTDTYTTAQLTRVDTIATQTASPQAVQTGEPEQTRATSSTPQPPSISESTVPASEQAISGERLMVTLVGGIIAGLSALAVWRILLS